MIHKRKISIQLMNHNETKIIHARTNSSLKAGASPIIHMIANSASSMNLKNSLFQPYEFWNKIGNIYWTSDIEDRHAVNYDNGCKCCATIFNVKSFGAPNTVTFAANQWLSSVLSCMNYENTVLQTQSL